MANGSSGKWLLPYDRCLYVLMNPWRSLYRLFRGKTISSCTIYRPIGWLVMWRRVVTMQHAEVYTLKIRWLTGTLWNAFATAAAASITKKKSDPQGYKESWHPVAWGLMKSSPKFITHTPFKDPEVTIILLDNCKKDQQKLWVQLSTMAYQHAIRLIQTKLKPGP